MSTSLPISFKHSTYIDSFGEKTPCIKMRWWKFFYHRYAYRAAIRLYYNLGVYRVLRWDHR